MKIQLVFYILVVAAYSNQLRKLKQGCECEDIAPKDSLYSCEDLEKMGTCEQEFMKGRCLCSCGKCGEFGEVLDCSPPLKYIQSQNNLQMFAALLSASNISDYLNSYQAAVTIFVPNDQAFRDFFGVMESSFLEMFTYLHVLEPVISYHIVNQPFYKNNLLRGAILDTMIQNQQGKASIRIDEKDISKLVGLGGPAQVIEWNISACQSVIHIIDTVLLPVDI